MFTITQTFFVVGEPPLKFMSRVIDACIQICAGTFDYKGVGVLGLDDDLDLVV